MSGSIWRPTWMTAFELRGGPWARDEAIVERASKRILRFLQRRGVISATIPPSAAHRR